tara:strand:+ start:173 stop:487 length:315 start_codon:yes stop_codon:yes gene_type:complete
MSEELERRKEILTPKQMDDLLCAKDHEFKDFINAKFDQHEKMDKLRLSPIKKDLEEVHGAVFGNGSEGLKLYVDRLWQSRNWIWVIAVSVAGKVVFDIMNGVKH